MMEQVKEYRISDKMVRKKFYNIPTVYNNIVILNNILNTLAIFFESQITILPPNL